MAEAPTVTEIERLLEHWLESEFSRISVDDMAKEIALLPDGQRTFALDWVRRAASANIQIGHMVARHVPQMLAHMDQLTIEAWILQAMDARDRDGLKAALDILRDPQRFVRLGREHAVGAVFDDIAGILRPFVCGLSGRHLRVEQGDAVWTDGETLFLPPVVAQMESAADNFQLAKAMVTLLWAQTRYGTFRVDAAQHCARFADPARAQQTFHALETLRLEACIARELPGLAREMKRLETVGAGATPSAPWQAYAAELRGEGTTVADSLRLLDAAYAEPAPHIAWQGELRPAEVAARMAARIAREKLLLKVKLGELIEDRQQQRPPRDEQAAKPEIALQAQEVETMELPRFELTI